MKKRNYLAGIMVIFSALIIGSAYYVKNDVVKKDDINVQYVVDEEGHPTVTYIENNASPNKLMKIIKSIESMEFVNPTNIYQVVNVIIKA